VAVGSITGTLTVPVLDNTYVEPVETVVAQLSNPNNGDVSIGIGTATATIADDDTASVSVASVGVMENGGSALFTVTLLGDVQDPFDVYYTTSDVTAQAGFDYVTATGTLSFHSVSGTTATFTVSINDDAVTEATEYYNVILTGISTPLVGIGQGTATGTIWDEDFSSIAIGTATPVVEGTAVEFPVTLTGAVQGGLTIAWSTSDGTAVAPGDYVAASGTVTFVGNDGETQTITITSNDDNIMESTENLTVTLGEITGFGGGLILIYAGDESAEGTLLDNDYSEVTVQATADGYEPSTNGQFTVVLSKPVDIPTTVTYTVGGNATMGADYGTLSGTVTFAALTTTETITIEVIDDLLSELCGETVSITLISTDNLVALGVPATATLTIYDNELPELLSDAASTFLGCDPEVTPPVFTVVYDEGGTFSPTTVTTDGAILTPERIWTQTWTATYTDECSRTVTPVTVTFTWVEAPVLELQAGSDDTQELCGPGTIEPIVYWLNGGATGATVYGLTPGLSYSFTPATPEKEKGEWLTIFGAASTTVNYTIVTSGSLPPCEELTVTGTITVHEVPDDPQITGPEKVCANQSVETYTASGTGVEYIWSITGGTGTSTTSSITITWGDAGTGTVSVTYVDANGCPPANPAVMEVTIHALPVATITGPVEVCETTEATYTTETGMTEYDWNVTGGAIVSGVGTSSITVLWGSTTPGTVSVTYTDTYGCMPSEPAFLEVIINQAATLSMTAESGSADQTICAGEPIEEIIYAIGGSAVSATVSFDPASPGMGYHVEAGKVIISGTATQTLTYTILTNGTASPCAEATVSGTITVNPLPVVSLTGMEIVCAGMEVEYTTEAGMAEYDWNVTGGTIVSGAGTASVTVHWGDGSTGTVTVNYEDPATGCTATEPTEMTVLIYEPSTITLTSAPGTDNQEICLGDTIQRITYRVDGGATGLEVLGLTPGLKFEVDKDIVAPDLLVTISGSTAVTVHYTVVTDGSLAPCVELTVSGTITVNLKPELVACARDTVIATSLDGTGDCSSTLALANGVDFAFTGSPAPVITYSFIGETTTGTGTWDGSISLPRGINEVTLVATNSCGVASCTFTAEVVDDEDPVISCVGNQTVYTDPGKATYTQLGTTWDAGAWDNCSTVTPTATYVLSGATTGSGSTLSGTAFGIGITTVEWTVKDSSDSTSTCSYTVKVIDNELPTLTCIGNVTLNNDPKVCTYTVKGTEFDLLAASDNSGIVYKSYKLGNGNWVTASTLKGVVFENGITVVTWKVADPSGNEATCSFEVRVIDNEKPVFDACGETFCVTLKPEIIRNRFGVFILAKGYLYDDVVRQHARDNCTASSQLKISYLWKDKLYTTPLMFTDEDGGDHLVKVFVEDMAGNSDSCCIIVTVPLPFKKGEIGNAGVTEDVWADLGMTVYPNPTKGKVYVDIRNLNDPKVTARVFNAAGAMVFNREFTTGGKIEIDLTGNVSGMYLLRLTADKREFTHKIILD
jgi:hypothetical protein